MEAFELQMNVTVYLNRPAAPSQDPTPSLSNGRSTSRDQMLIDLEERGGRPSLVGVSPVCFCP